MRGIVLAVLVVGAASNVVFAQTVAPVCERLTEARIPCAPVLRPAEVIAQEHLAVRQFFPVLPHPARRARQHSLPSADSAVAP